MKNIRLGLSIVVIAMLLALISCGGGHGAFQPALQSEPHLSADLQQALQELDALPTPPGIDAAEFASLKAGLRKLLIERGTNKFTSAAPGSSRSKVTDLAVVPDGAGARFHWTYRNEGDYNQDGLVSIQDLALLGMNWGKDSTAPDWDTAQVADGSGNNKVELGDLTSIGANFLNRVTRYSLQHSDTPDPGGVWTEAADVDFTASSVPAGELRQFDFLLASPSAGYYRVAPCDSALAGTPSDSLQWQAQPADVWPMLGHDLQHTGRSPFAGPATNAVQWIYATSGQISTSSPVIGADGTIYVGSDDGSVYAINPDGSLQPGWPYATGTYIDSAPTIGADGTVYIGNDDGNVFAINPDGSLKSGWPYLTGGPVYSSPAIGADGTVYVGSLDGNLYAINPDASLAAGWPFATGDSIYSSPAIGADGTIYVGSDDFTLYALNPDGSLKYSYTTGNYIDSSPAIGADGTVYVGSYDGSLYAINPDGSLKPGWPYATGGAIVSAPAIGADGTVYVGSDDNNLYAINPDGSLAPGWPFAAGDMIETSPAIDVNGTVYIGSLDGNLYAINPDGTLLWSFAAPALGYWWQSSPAIGADGTVYAGNMDNGLYAFGGGGTTTYSASGYVKTAGGTGIPGVTMSFTGGLASVTTDSTGYWFRDGIADGNYTVSPGLFGYTFDPTSSDFSIAGGDASVSDFIGMDQGLILAPDTLYAIPLQTSASVGEPVTVCIATGQPANSLVFLSSVGLTAETAGTYVPFSFNVGDPGGAGLDTDGYWVLMGPPPPPNGAYLVQDETQWPYEPTDIGGGFQRYNFGVVTQGPFTAPASIGNGAILFNVQLTFSAPGVYHLGFQQNDGEFDQTFYSDDLGNNFYWTTLDNSNTITVSGGSPTYTASGYVLTSLGAGIPGVTMSFTGGLASVTTDSTGYWSRDGIADGNYTVSPGLFGYTFDPASYDFSIAGGDASVADFIGTDQGLILDPDTLYAIPLQVSAAVGEPVTVCVATGQPANSLAFLSSVGLTVETAGTYVPFSFNVGDPGGAWLDTDGYWALMGPPPPPNGAYFVQDETQTPYTPTDIGGGFQRYNFGVVTQGPFATPASIGNGAVLFNVQLTFSAPGFYHLGFQQNDGQFDQTFYSDDLGNNYYWTTLDSSYTITVN